MQIDEEGLVLYFDALDAEDKETLKQTEQYYSRWYYTHNYTHKQLKKLNRSVTTAKSSLIEGVPTYRIL